MSGGGGAHLVLTICLPPSPFTPLQVLLARSRVLLGLSEPQRTAGRDATGELETAKRHRRAHSGCRVGEVPINPRP